MARWEIRIMRSAQQSNGAKTRTIGTYQVYHDDEAAPGLSGVTAEAEGPGDNSKKDNGKRIAAGTYPLWTHEGEHYWTIDYTPSGDVHDGPKPGIALDETDQRIGILIHPGKNEFLSSIGCINPCTALPDADELIDYPGSRARVIALIADMRAYLGANFPAKNDRRIPHAWAVIEGEPD
jgi:hypothetical protein